MISCQYIKDIYENYIEKFLVEDELEYSILPIQQLDMIWNSITHVGNHKFSKDGKFYFINDKLALGIDYGEIIDILVCDSLFSYSNEFIEDICCDYFKKFINTNKAFAFASDDQYINGSIYTPDYFLNIEPIQK